MRNAICLTAVLLLLAGCSGENEQEKKAALRRCDEMMMELAGVPEVNEIEKLLDSGGDVNAEDESGMTPLQRLADSRYREGPWGSLGPYYKPSLEEEEMRLEFRKKAWKRIEKAIRQLIAKGADINAKDGGFGFTPLHWAAFRGNERIARLLVSKGADVNAKSKAGLEFWFGCSMSGYRYQASEPKGGLTPLHVAAEFGHEEIVRLLLESGADVNAKNREGKTPLDVAATCVERKLLQDHGGLTGETAGELAQAAVTGNLDRVKELVSYGRDVNLDNGCGVTPLHEAARAGYTEIAQFLISAGAYLNAKDETDITPLHLAAQNGLKGLIELMLGKGADASLKSRDGNTPLHLSASAGHADATEILIEKGADVNVRNIHGRTPLHEAVKRGCNNTAELLITRGADLNAADSEGRTPLHLAVVVKREALVELLLSKGARVNASDNFGASPLDVAEESRYRDEKILKMLRDKGGMSGKEILEEQGKQGG